jgi:hypothetical protein
MKPNEVMIGDWLRFTDPHNTEETEFSQVTMEIIGFDSPKYWRCFSPIEITPEILKANGFKSGEQYRFVLYKLGKESFSIAYNSLLKTLDAFTKRIQEGCTIRATPDQSNLSIHIQYVHELQHAMRLMGLHDLADNFVIEKGGEQ